MSTQAPNAGPGPEHGEGPGGPPPWIDPSLQQQVTWRDGDVVISVPAKSGTTWTMNIVHQLRSGGDNSFFDIYGEVPWLELVPKPDSDRNAIIAAFDTMTHDRRRAFKTHSAPPDLPYIAPGTGPDVRYVIVARNPDEAVASFRPFIASHSDDFFAMWGVDPSFIVGGSFDEYFAGMGSHALVPMIFGFLAGWWPLRNESNVQFVHYADMVREPEASIRRIAEFTGFEVADDAWPTVLEHTSFSWMKANEEKFELRSVSDVPPLDPGAMLRKGKVGASKDDGVTPEMSATIAAIGNEIVGNQQALDWIYRGGPLPG